MFNGFMRLSDLIQWKSSAISRPGHPGEMDLH